MKFNEVLDALKNGERLVNSTLSNMGAFIVRQVPQTVSAEIVPKMTSLPASAKEHISETNSEISYKDQVLLVWWNPTEGRYNATSYVPTWEDIFREDWTIA